MKQNDFALKLTSSDIETDDLEVHRLSVLERMSQLYCVHLEITSKADKPEAAASFVGARLKIDLLLENDVQRSFHGLVSRVREHEGRDGRLLGYKIEMVPQWWSASLVETLDIFLNTTVPAMIEKKLGMIDLELGADYMTNFAGLYPMRDMLVQYRETDLAFVSRWMEHHGIYFFFSYAGSLEQLVISDNPDGYLDIPGDTQIAYQGEGEEAGIFELEMERSAVPRFYVCRDYNEETPTVELQENWMLEEGWGGGVIMYGDHCGTQPELVQMVKLRAEERLSEQELLHGRSDDARFAMGHKFELTGHPRYDGHWVVLEVEHTSAMTSGGQGVGDERAYQNRFIAMRAERTFRPPRVTPVPRVHGVVSGIVETGQAGIERDVKIDHQGRYLVRFLFDTAAPGERKASCAVRMMQPSAGTNHGVHFPLRPGTEVAVGFIDGNVDRPVIMGALPNPITPTPVAAAESTKSRIKTRTGIVIEFDDATRGS